MTKKTRIQGPSPRLAIFDHFLYQNGKGIFNFLNFLDFSLREASLDNCSKLVISRYLMGLMLSLIANCKRKIYPFLPFLTNLSDKRHFS